MKKIYSLIIALVFCALSSIQAQVVINEVYGGGGNSLAPFQNDFVELYNTSGSAVPMNSWSIQYTSSTGTSWNNQKLIFSGTIPGNGYFLIQLAGGATGSPLPGADATGTFNMSATAGKIVLCNNSTSVSAVVNPTDANIVDKVGYGSGTNGFETAAAPAPSNTTSIQRTPIGTDNNNNSTDFTTGSPSPTIAGSGPDLTPPTVVTLNPADDASGISTVSNLSIVFSEPILKNVGVITVHNSTTSSEDYIFLQTSNPNVSISGNTLTISGVNLQPASSYFITIPDSVIKDLAGNKFAGFNTATTWNFSTGSMAAPVPGQLNFTYNLNTAANVFSSDGFKQYSVRGPLVWVATTFGNSGNALQMNGFFNGSNQANEDWLILPPFDLSSTNFPLLSFFSRTKFNGDPLQLKVSTDYPGFGDPNNFTWTDINGKFPAETSDAWTQSTNIDLSAFKQSNAYIAFVYTSTQDDGERWTLDDIRVDNSSTAPPPAISISASSLQFGYVPNGSTADKSFLLNAANITNDVTLAFKVGSGAFLLSKDGTTYSSSLTYTVAEANNVAKTVHVRFAPTQTDGNYNDTIEVVSGSLDTTISLRGTSTDPIKTLEVVNWNLEWFGSTKFGPTNENLQEQNVRTIMQNIGADLYALAEVVDESRLQNIVNSMPGYAYVINHYGSHTNPNESNPSPLSEAQRLAFVYKTSVFSNIDTAALLSVGINTPGDISTTSYNNWASGRFPFMMSADVTLDGVTKNVKFILIHAKANTTPTVPSYTRRKAGADELHALLNSTYASDNIVLLGDFNDDLDQTITDGVTPPTTSYVAFTSDPSNYTLLTLPLSQAGKRSTVSHDNVIDHVVVSSELGPNFISGSSNILTDVTGLVSSYATTTSDHYPVFTDYTFAPQALPVKLNYFAAEKQRASVKLTWSSSLESNSKEYIVERSLNGLQFQTIGKISANGRPSSYQLIDQSPNSGNNYYRLKMVDLDGKSDFSKTIRIRFDIELLITIKPNPATSFVMVTMDRQLPAASVSIYNQQGALVKQLTRSFGANQPSIIDVTGLAKGIYILQLKSGEITRTEKLIVQ